MRDVVRLKLCELVRQIGFNLCDDPRRCEAFLRDSIEANREITALKAAAREGVGEELRRSSAGVPKGLIVFRLAKRLHENYGLAEDLARWAVESWAIALGIGNAEDFRYSFQCPHCGAMGTMASKLAGKKIHCPNCNVALAISANGQEVFLVGSAANP